MSEHDDTTKIAVLRAQFAEACRRMEEIRADVRAEQAETRAEMKAGFERIDGRYNELEARLRNVEQEQGQAKERLSTWRMVVPLLSGLAAAAGSFAKDLIAGFGP